MTYQRSKNESMFAICIAVAVVFVGSLTYQLPGVDSGTMFAIAASPFKHPVASQVMFWVAVFTIHIGGISAYLSEFRRVPICA